MSEQKVGAQGEALGAVKKTSKIRMEKLFEQVKKCASHYPNIYKIVLFGSRARGDYRPNSDIDLAIFSKSKSNSNLEVANFTNDIEDLDTLLKFDIIFITPDTDPRLLQNVKKEGVVIMELLTNKVENLRKAVDRLSEGILELQANESSVVRDGVIQRFEFTTELAWKAAREYLMDQGFIDINSPKSVMKEAFSYGLITDDKIWIQILNDRNLTSHIYKEEIADEICDRIIKTYFQEFKALSKRLALI
ncbi:HI0074 family nucleotidyltransferase substrate-binding subunit [uncultured Acetobacterium sp.]|uniref:HI0074 family nucleotidyltransferase substrate-binding subunit n=1 Tax=uncultured Acetobacterium sp. TaxID=217139 RepID=UPI0025EC88F4|nr:HI0074 family nucleotidyltransferase substrate-binding subunit [uncultured Acetobacterium sp.]